MCSNLCQPNSSFLRVYRLELGDLDGKYVPESRDDASPCVMFMIGSAIGVVGWGCLQPRQVGSFTLVD